MKYRTLILTIFLLCSCAIMAQTNEEDEAVSASLSMLLVTYPPGFILLEDAPASIERPTSATDLLLTVVNRTDDLTKLPEGFALEVAPYWLVAGSDLTYDEYANPQNIGLSILQTLSLSVATSADIPASLAPGVRFSILRGQIDKQFDNYVKRLDEIYEKLDNVLIEFSQEYMKRHVTDGQILELKKQLREAEDKQTIAPLIETLIGQREAALKQEVEDEVRTKLLGDLETIKQEISQLRIKRIGAKLDVAASMVIDFQDRSFEDPEITRWGGWMNGGYEWRKWGLLGVVSAIIEEIDLSNDISLDFGARAFLNIENLPFAVSAEGVARRRDQNDWDWRLAFLFDYIVAKNTTVSFTFGRDFEGNQSGNLLAMVNLVTGIGSNRPIR